ncbi:LPXTG cell wall anchor domain-containing protein [Streptomyces sp. NRRL S-87]|uniref:LPXTG cell wall anchor domain-containing protein n=1 Tax=Streptomyces sp. NRRL S-87 TaxID=1463920 RepID=UPI000A567240|nr:LPXTG cell wall anchor domain-containing protein [Streptomyces sp. NRRL S-87]
MALTAPRPSFGPLALSARRRTARRTGLLVLLKGGSGHGAPGTVPGPGTAGTDTRGTTGRDTAGPGASRRGTTRPGASRRVLAAPAGLLPAVLVGCGAALLPWMVVLATTLPQTAEVSHWATAWVGLDALIAAGLLATGAFLRKGDPRLPAVAAATATLLVTDAWFDITTAPAGAGLATAVAMAACAELPLAGACAALALRTPPARERS